MNEIKLFKKQFDPYLKDCLDKKIENITNYTKDPSILNYVKYIKKIILAGGKRIRPYIAYLMYKALEGEEKEKTLKLLVFLELFHVFCLVHDDIMDKANLRHNVSTIHKYILDTLRKQKRINDLRHTGNSQAILAGDFLFSWSQEILNLNTEFNQKIMQKVKTLFCEMVDEVIVGQMIDVDITTRSKVSKDLIDEKTRLKTAGYSFIKPLQIGAALSGKDNINIQKFCKEFGLTIGIAFQAQDDLLDITSSTKQLGKTASLDKSNRQHTYFSHYKSNNGGKRIIRENFDKAKKLIENLRTEKIYKQKFLNLVKIIEQRRA